MSIKLWQIWTYAAPYARIYSHERRCAGEQNIHHENSLVLTGFSIAMRVAGIAFSMYVAAGVGAEGMGLYQLTYSAFTFAVTLATAGISVAVTRVLTEEQGMKRRGSERPVMRCALIYASLISLTAAVCVLLGSGYIGRVLLSDERTVLSLRVLAPRCR